MQSKASAHTFQQSSSTKSQPASRSGRRSSKYSAPDQRSQESDYHFHKTPLGLFESFFADTQQHHCSATARNNPGTILLNISETSESESTDEDGDVTIRDQDESADWERAEKVEGVSPDSVGQFEGTEIDTLQEVVDEAKEDQMPDSSTSSHADNDEKKEVSKEMSNNVPT